MRRIIRFVQNHSLSILAAFAFFVGTNAATPATFLMTYQPECPKELLK